MAYIDKEEVANIRKLLKENFKGWSFINQELRSCGCSKRDFAVLNITIKKGTVDLSSVTGDDLWYWSELDLKEKLTADAVAVILKIKDIAASQDWFDKSDSQTDYFHIAYYIHIKVDEDYQKIEIKKKQTTDKIFKGSTSNEVIFSSGIIEPFIHTKSGEELQVLKLDIKLTKDRFKSFNDWMKSNDKGYYSRYAGGFILSNIQKNEEQIDG